MTEPYPAILEWNDAHSDVTEQVWSVGEVAHGPLVIRTLGWVTRYDATGVTMFTERIDNQDGTFSYRGRGFVPAGMVVSVMELVETPKRRRKKT
jgi:hypothetical protein